MISSLRYLFLTIALCLFFLSFSAMSTQSVYSSLVSDDLAENLGDVVTVLIYESVQADSRKGDLENDDSSYSGRVQVDDNSHSVGLGIGYRGTIDKSTKRTGFFKATVTARVTRINSNNEDLLYIEAKQSIRIEEQMQNITLSGWINRTDLSGNNTILSNRISDAQITITGKEVLKTKSFFGWLTSFF